MRPMSAVGALAVLLLALSPSDAQMRNAKPFTVNVMLCDTPERAIAYAAALDGGAAEDEAKDTLGRAAGMEVCDKFIGLATVREERSLTEKGITYKVTALQFEGVKKMKWMAQPLN